jgi:hypothetical protein
MAARKRLLSAVADSRRLHLHARRSTLPHPSGKGTLALQAELPASLPPYRRSIRLRHLGGLSGRCAFAFLAAVFWLAVILVPVAVAGTILWLSTRDSVALQAS